jgi:8-oxo-dGTP pyrophosphatase MutT (NUDIX family)
MPTRRETSAGGVVLRAAGGPGGHALAVIRPAGLPDGTWTLPKGQIDPGEGAEEAALREVHEETGLRCRTVRALSPIRYFYVREGVRIAKTVRFWLMEPVAGTINDLAEAMRREVAEARWIPLGDAPRLLSYRGERALLEDLVAQG